MSEESVDEALIPIFVGINSVQLKVPFKAEAKGEFCPSSNSGFLSVT